MSTQKWALDPTHSEIQFKVKHLMITTVTGSFKTFEGSVETEKETFAVEKSSPSVSTDPSKVLKLPVTVVIIKCLTLNWISEWVGSSAHF